MAHKGTVVNWYSRKGYGFIKCRDFDEDLFVHVSGFGGGELVEGGDVSFDVQDDRSGKKRCINVKGSGVDPERQKPARRDSRDRGDRRGGDRDRQRDSRDKRYDSRDRRGGDRDRRDSGRDGRDSGRDGRDSGRDRRRD